jgi:hypothetical protein
LHRDVQTASLRSRELVQQIEDAHRRPLLLRWTAVGMVIAFALFCCGMWVGRISAIGWARGGF